MVRWIVGTQSLHSNTSNTVGDENSANFRRNMHERVGRPQSHWPMPLAALETAADSWVLVGVRQLGDECLGLDLFTVRTGAAPYLGATPLRLVAGVELASVG